MKKKISIDFHTEWFMLDNLPELIFDHLDLLQHAKKQIRYKAAIHPFLFELLPQKFTIPQLQTLYEGIYHTTFDSQNLAEKFYQPDS